MSKNSNIEINKIKPTFQEISLFKNPLLTIYTLFIIMNEQFVILIRFLIRHRILIIISILFIGLNFIKGPHSEVFNML
jgi:hypothetical protein